MIIRQETPADYDAIFDLTERAFKPTRHYDGSEAPAIGKMRSSGDLLLSLVAESEGRIIGHVAFSDVWIADQSGAFAALGPISVELDCQKQGIGTAMAHLGLKAMKDQGFRGVVLLGNPKIYGPMGFETATGLSYRNLPAEVIQQVVFTGPPPTGSLRFAAPLEMAP